MKSLKVIRVSEIPSDIGLFENPARPFQIDVINWPSFSYKPDVRCRLAYTYDRLLLAFDVTEQSVRAVETSINGPVHNDSCVEFFISFDGSNYYNFEFNCIGTPHLAYGPGRQNREKPDTELVSRIRVVSSLGNQPFGVRTGGFTWHLNAVIPLTCFLHHPHLSLSGTTAYANFYKCGDALPEPHFVTWNPVETSDPDYHRPEFFGQLIFD